MALKNAEEALARHLANASSQRRLLRELAAALDLGKPPTRIEIYDNSHIQGKHAVGGMVVAGPEGFEKGAYRRFNIKGEGKFATVIGDDFAMMRQIIHRRFSRALKEDAGRQSGNWPDLLLIDGGVGQLSAVHEALDDLGLVQLRCVTVASIALELVIPVKKKIKLSKYNPTGQF